MGVINSVAWLEKKHAYAFQKLEDERMPVFAQDYAPEQLVGHARPRFGLLFVLWGGLGRTYVF